MFFNLFGSKKKTDVSSITNPDFISLLEKEPKKIIGFMEDLEDVGSQTRKTSYDFFASFPCQLDFFKALLSWKGFKSPTDKSIICAIAVCLAILAHKHNSSIWTAYAPFFLKIGEIPADEKLMVPIIFGFEGEPEERQLCGVSQAKILMYVIPAVFAQLRKFDRSSQIIKLVVPDLTLLDSIRFTANMDLFSEDAASILLSSKAAIQEQKQDNFHGEIERLNSLISSAPNDNDKNLYRLSSWMESNITRVNRDFFYHCLHPFLLNCIQNNKQPSIDQWPVFTALLKQLNVFLNGGYNYYVIRLPIISVLQTIWNHPFQKLQARRYLLETIDNIQSWIGFVEVTPGALMDFYGLLIDKKTSSPITDKITTIIKQLISEKILHAELLDMLLRLSNEKNVELSNQGVLFIGKCFHAVMRNKSRLYDDDKEVIWLDKLLSVLKESSNPKMKKLRDEFITSSFKGVASKNQIYLELMPILAELFQDSNNEMQEMGLDGLYKFITIENFFNYMKFWAENTKENPYEKNKFHSLVLCLLVFAGYEKSQGRDKSIKMAIKADTLWIGPDLRSISITAEQALILDCYSQVIFTQWEAMRIQKKLLQLIIPDPQKIAVKNNGDKKSEPGQAKAKIEIKQENPAKPVLVNAKKNKNETAVKPVFSKKVAVRQDFSPSRYRFVSYGDAVRSPSVANENEYLPVFKRIFRKQAARIILKAYRQYKHWEDKTTSNDPLSMRFIKEPLGRKYEEHAENIRCGYWTKLDFQEPNFVRNLFKALRFAHITQITPYQVATALLLHGMRQSVCDAAAKAPLRQYTFDEKGPYDPKTISYASDENIAAFKRGLQKLPETEKCYFSITLSKENEQPFLTSLIYRISEMVYMEVGIQVFAREILEKYVRRNVQDKTRRDNLISHIRKFPCESTESMNIIWNFFNGHNMPSVFTKSTQTEDNMKPPTLSAADLRWKNMGLLAAILIVEEQMPSLVVSPDYDETKPDSPLLCMILPTISSLIALQQALHGIDTTYPEFTLGKLANSELLYTLMNPEKELRPVELTHPDVVRLKCLHGAWTDDVILTYHDVLLHLFRNGANPLKNLYRELITFLENTTGQDFYKGIWSLVDMDSNIGRVLRERLNMRRSVRHVLISFMQRILFEMGNNFWSQTDSFDNNLLLIIAMIMKRKEWKSYLGDYPEEFFPQKTPEGIQGLINGVYFFHSPKNSNVIDYSLFHSVFKIIYPRMFETEFKNDPIFYILQYRLRNFNASNKSDPMERNTENFRKIHSLLTKLNTIGLHKIFEWGNNSGILIRKGFIELPEYAIEKLDVGSLYQILTAISNKENIPEPKKKNGLAYQSLFFSAQTSAHRNENKAGFCRSEFCFGLTSLNRP